MNNRDRAQQIADEHGNDAYSVAMAMLEGQNKIKVTQTDIGDSEWRSVRYVVSSVGGETDYAELSKAHILERDKLKRQRDASDVDINKIKAEAVREEINKDNNKKADLIFALGLCVSVMPAGHARDAALKALGPYYQQTGEPK